jgi:lysophospholipase L1-like esterase
MVAAAQARGIKVAFVFLPYFEGPAEVQERALYEAAGPLFDAHFVSRHDEWFADVAHLNRAGAIVLSDWLAEKLVPILKEPQP